MIANVIYLEDGKAIISTPDKIHALVLEGKTIWVDILKPTAEDMLFLEKEFSLHRLACEDSLAGVSRPKLSEYPEHLFLALHSIHYINTSLDISELYVFFGENFLITVHRQKLGCVDSVLSLANKWPNSVGNRADFLLYLILDCLVESYFPIMDSIEDDIDRTEDDVFKEPTRKALNKTFNIKRV
ncbi:MAG: hypothetical protein HZB98_09430, partial [Bacteroidia bacterium]|nr:hypothetical protein [Bacteroidia bacterium]